MIEKPSHVEPRRQAQCGDPELFAQQGVFAAISLDGAVVQAYRNGDEAMYGSGVTRREILDGKIALPKAATRLSPAGL